MASFTSLRVCAAVSLAVSEPFFGVIDGGLVYVYSQDASVMNGSVGEMHAKKIANRKFQKFLIIFFRDYSPYFAA